ncbi:immune inhibitor A [bacterium]|nr:immune inhibitor A [bacterium]MBU1881238.1 immune inhibitor A [bacterium]
MKRTSISWIFTLVAFLLILQIPVHANVYHQVLIPDASEQTLRSLALLGLPLDDARPVAGGGVEMPLSQSDVDLLQGSGISYQIVQDDLVKYYGDICRENLLNIPAQTDDDPVHMKYGSTGGYYNFEEIVADLDSMFFLYPNICTEKEVLDYGWDGNPIYMVKISDNPTIDENEPEALFDATHHPREVGGYTAVLYAMWWLLENYGTDPEATYLVDNRELYFVPVVNPDGLLYNELTNPGGGGMWRKNRRDNGGGVYGVDNNRNYTYQWGYDNLGSSPNPSSIGYRGPYAGSEPETSAMMNFISARDIYTCQTFHTYGGWYLTAYAYATIPPEAYDVHQEYMRAMAKDNNYEFGYACLVFYAANGNALDYHLHDHDIISVSPETGGVGFYQPIEEIIPDAAENLRACLHTGWTAGGLIEMTGLSVDDGFLTPDETEELIIEIQNKGWGTSEPIDYQLTTIDPWVTLDAAVIQVDSLERRTYFDNSGTPFIATVTPGCPIGHKVYFDFIVNQESYTRTQLCSLYVGEPTELFSDGAEVGFNNWTINNYWGMDASDPHTGSFSFSDSPGRNYYANTNASMTLANALDLSNYDSAWLEFWTKWEIEVLYDFLQIEFSTNNGASWDPVDAIFTTPGSGDGVQPENQPGYDGSSPIWLYEKIDLSPYLGESSVKLRFELRSDNVKSLDGWYIDDIKVLGFPSEVAPYPDINITLTPLNPPIQIPASGGNVYFDVFVENADPMPVDFDAWLETAYEGGAPSTVVLRAFTNYQPGWTINRPGMWYPIDAGYPAGNYTFAGKVGENPDLAWDESSFPFEKLGTDHEAGFIPYPVDGAPNPFDTIETERLQTTNYKLITSFPNPFNPSTVLSFRLSDVSQVNLSVYDISGRLVATLIDGFRDVGVHEVTFEASGLASGIYLYRLQTSGSGTIPTTASGKMVLMK